MSRSQLIIFGIVAIVIIAVAAIVLGGGGGDTESPAAELGSPPQDLAGEPDIDAAGAEDAIARFEAWAVPLRAAGFTITRGRVSSQNGAIVISGLDIGGPQDSLAWSWSAASVRVEDIGNDSVVLTPSGAQALTVIVDGEAMASSINAESIRIELQRDDSGRATALVANFVALAIQGEDDDPATIANGELRIDLAEGDGVLAAGSTVSLRLSDLVLPGQAGNPLGTEINLVAADLVFDRAVSGLALGRALQPWLTGAGGLAVNSLELEWGTLLLAGNGVLSLDEMGRPASRLEVEIVDILDMLDAFHVVLRFDRDLLADVYAVLLGEMGNNPDAESLPFTIAIENGQIVLVGESRGIGDIVLGTVTPLFTPATAE